GDTGTVRGNDLNRIYAGSKVAVGDTLCPNFAYPHYWSDRVYETLGRGGMLIHPNIRGMSKSFKNRQHLLYYTYGEFTQLRMLIDYYVTHGAEREKIHQAGHAHVKAHHTYRHRWATILETVFPAA